MLTDEQIQNNKIKYLELMSKLNFDMTDISAYLDLVDYFNAPYSSQYFRCYKGGLCHYALDMYNALKAQANRYFPGRYTEQDIVVVALFKNMYRAEMYEAINGNYRTKKDRPTYGDVGFSSFATARHFYPQFTDEQMIAVCHGAPNDSTPDIQDIRRSYPLATLTAIAELLVTSFA